jgi:hypothetical protein
VPIILETIRNTSTTFFGTIIIGFGIALAESIFGGPKRESLATVISGEAPALP